MKHNNILLFMANKVLWVISLPKRMFFHSVYMMFSLYEFLGNVRKLRATRYDAMSGQFALSESREMTFLVRTHDRFIGRSIYVSGQFDFNKFEIVYHFIGDSFKDKKLTLLDIGANIGSIGIPALKKCYVSKCVFFEPEPTNCKLLKSNVILNDVESDSTVYEVALGEKSGIVDFELSKNNFGDHRIRVNDSTNGTYDELSRRIISVPVKPLNDYFKEFDVSSCLIWMDTQGYEGFVLSGASHFLNARVPMVIEFWPYGMARTGSYELLLASLKETPYEYYVDLGRSPEIKMKLSEKTLNDLWNDLGENDQFTDILIF
ncbi:MAG: FkbM family methyltransferase [Mariprofundus sp.]|nr:FkbM family methyltransferase [Mariprofundus sp.]